mgnify:FL=1
MPAAVTGGIIGERAFLSSTSFGLTMAVAYPSIIGSSEIWAGPWKHDDLKATLDGTLDSGPIFHNEAPLQANDPFQAYMFFSPTGAASAAACQTAMANATIRRGDVGCLTDVALLYRADPVAYNRTTQWPFGTWGCVQAHYQNLGTTNMSVKVWVNNNLIIDFDGFNGSSFLANRQGYSGFTLGNYANTNAYGPPFTTQTTYRYEDNVHITAGAPVSCSQIGFPF